MSEISQIFDFIQENKEDEVMKRWVSDPVCVKFFRGEPDNPFAELVHQVIPDFRELPGVEKRVVCGCGCGHIDYCLSVKRLHVLADSGRTGLEQYVKAEKVQQMKEELEFRKLALNAEFPGQEIADDLRDQLISASGEIRLVNPSLAVVKGRRLEYGSSGGIGYWDQVTVLYGSQRQLQEWNWRDRYSAGNDKPWLAVESIGDVTTKERDGEVVVSVELVNSRHKNRTASFSFDHNNLATVAKLSEEEKADFLLHVEKEKNMLMAELALGWAKKDAMPNPRPMSSVVDRYVSYRQPSIRQTEVSPEFGLAAFVVEEQIDHRGSDPQFRHQLRVLVAGSEESMIVTDDHGYESDGGALLEILSLEKEGIIINTKTGVRMVPAGVRMVPVQ